MQVTRSKRYDAMLPKKREAFKAILRFLTHGDVKLHKEEEEMLKRWEYCDSLLRSKSKNEQQIIDELCTRFNIKPHTARNDIYQTQQLFGKSRQLNKKYLAHHHLERIDRDIQAVRSMIFKTGPDGKLVPLDSKEMMALAKLHEAYTYQLNSLPDEPIEDKTPPPIFHFILAPGQVIEKPLLLEDALKKADEIILKQDNDGVYKATAKTGMDHTAEETE